MKIAKGKLYRKFINFLIFIYFEKHAKTKQNQNSKKCCCWFCLNIIDSYRWITFEKKKLSLIIGSLNVAFLLCKKTKNKNQTSFFLFHLILRRSSKQTLHSVSHYLLLFSAKDVRIRNHMGINKQCIHWRSFILSENSFHHYTYIATECRNQNSGYRFSYFK